MLLVLLALASAACNSWSVADSAGQVLLEVSNTSYFKACGRNLCQQTDLVCQAGSSLTGIFFSNGTVVCRPNSAQNTTYLTGFGLTTAPANPLVFEVDTTIVQLIAQSSCPSGSAIRSLSPDGTVACESFPVATADITSVIAGTGLTGGGVIGDVTLNVDTNAIQQRVTGTCTSGQAMQSIAGDGTTSCATFVNSVSGSTGVTVTGGTTSTVSITADTTYLQRRVTGTCSSVQAMYSIDATGTTVQCIDPVMSLTAGSGLTATRTPATNSWALGVDTTYLQRRVGACPASQGLTSVDAAGVASCTQFVTSVVSGGIVTATAAGGVVTLSTPNAQTRLATTTCPANQAYTAIASSGTATCTAFQSPLSAGTGITINAGSVSYDNTVIQSRVTGTCSGSTAIASITATGTVTCTASVPQIKAKALIDAGVPSASNVFPTGTWTITTPSTGVVQIVSPTTFGATDIIVVTAQTASVPTIHSYALSGSNIQVTFYNTTSMTPLASSAIPKFSLLVWN